MSSSTPIERSEKWDNPGPVRALLCLLAVLSAPAGAAPTATLLDEGVGGRAMAMGGAGAALAKGGSAMYWNPARLSAVKRPETAITRRTRNQCPSATTASASPLAQNGK